MADHTDVVAAVKASLEPTNNLQTPCGAFKITKRVAWALRGEGAGLLKKPNGNNCEGFSVDIICYPDGTIYDILVNAETENRPAWNLAGHVEPERYQPAIDPGDVISVPTPPEVPPVVIVPPPPAPPAPPTPAVDVAALAAAVDRVNRQQQDLIAAVGALSGVVSGLVAAVAAPVAPVVYVGYNRPFARIRLTPETPAE